MNTIEIKILDHDYKQIKIITQIVKKKKMTELLINEGTLFHNILLEETNKNINRIRQMQNMTKTMNTLFQGFTDSLGKFCRQMFKKAKNDQDQDPSIVFLTKFIIDLLTQLNKKVNSVHKKIASELMQPMEQFYTSQQQSYKQILQKSGEQLAAIQANSSFLAELTKNFNANKNISDLGQTQRAELKQIYEFQMQKCNEKWLLIKDQYQQILLDGNSINSFRCNFMIKNQIKLCKQINKLVGSPTVDEALSNYEQLFEENEQLSMSIKQKIRDKFGKSILLEERAMCQFNQENQFALRQKTLIDDFITLFTSCSNVKQDEKKHEIARCLILQNFHWSHYFLTRMRTNLHTQIKLPAVKYHQMTTIIKYLFAICAQNQQNQSILYNLLYISYRMTYNNSYIIRQLGKHEKYWQHEERWKKLIEFVRSLKEDSFQKRLSKAGNRNNKNIKSYVRSGLQWISQTSYHQNFMNRIGTDKKLRSQKMITDVKYYQIVCQMNFFMARLQIEQKFIFNFMVKIGNHYGFSLENIKKLLKFHYFNKQNNIDKIGRTFVNRKKKLQEKYKNISNDKKIVICIGKCIKYLPASSQLLKLRLVNKFWAEQLKNKIHVRFLIEQKNQSFISKNRLNFYKGLCPPVITYYVFQKMVEQLPDFTQHSDIIALDAKRSLSWDETLRQKLILILKCYAFYHPNVGYLQGMNYLCENILKLTDDVFTAYKIFQHLMNNQFYGMYSANFDGLKMKIYQFMRIVQRQKPKLYNHFLSENLQGEHFLLPWAITLWGQMSGDLIWLLWDGFLCKGWKWWIKTGLWLLNILEPQLLNMNFQEIMKTFSELSTGLLNMNSTQLKDFGINFDNAKNQIDQIPVHLETLKAIQKEYRLKVEMVNQYIKKVKVNKKL